MTCDCVVNADSDYGNYGSWENFSEKIVKGRKEYVCGECGQPIQKGVMHEYASGFWEGEFDSHRTCISCVSARNSFCCTWLYGNVWNDINNHINDAGGQVTEECILKLEPKARDRVLGEIEDIWEFRGND